METRKGRRVVYALHAHLVFVTKRRRKVFNAAHLKRLEEICRDVCEERVSSRRLKVEFPRIATFWSVRKSEGALWSPSYFVGSVGGAPMSVLKQYIENHDRR